ncbi:MAG TPA: c-type cytochrome [Solirubrobacteraceae bacterium]|nr:c-type cytochrome [Solirubrobacteraceae bacterium]
MSRLARTIATRLRGAAGARARWGALSAAALLLAACEGVALAQPRGGVLTPPSQPAKPTVQLGHELFEANCASCHGGLGQGISHPRPGAGDISGAAPSLHGVGAEAADFYLRTGFMPLSNIHAEPSNRRVPFTNKQVEAITDFVASLGAGPAIPHPKPRAGALNSGFELFTEDCAGCHQSLARGGFVTGARVPPLQGVDATEIAEAVRIGPYLMPRFSTKRISDAQLNSIIRYVLSTNRPDNRGGWSIGNLGPIPEGLVAWLAAIALAVLCLGLGRRLRA